MKNNQGFTLIELLIVIAVIAILAVGAYVALDPATRLMDSRNATRWTDASGILDAVKVDQVDNGGTYLAAITALSDDAMHMIGDSTSGTCEDVDVLRSGIYDCLDVTITEVDCVDLTGLVTEGYLASVPSAPTTSSGDWGASTDDYSGYVLTKAANGTIKIEACNNEGTGSISVSR